MTSRENLLKELNEKLSTRNNGSAKRVSKRVMCKCGKDFNVTSFEYHKLRCDIYKSSQKDGPYSVLKVDEMIEKHSDNQWIAKLVYRCKVGEVMKIVVPTKEEAMRVTNMSRYYAKKKRMKIVYRTEKIWRGINLFLALAKSERK